MRVELNRGRLVVFTADGRHVQYPLGLLALPVLPLLLLALAPQGPEERLPEVLIVGTFHMANPGQDLINPDAGDVLSDERQAEIADLVGRLARFLLGKNLIAVGLKPCRRIFKQIAHLFPCVRDGLVYSRLDNPFGFIIHCVLLHIKTTPDAGSGVVQKDDTRDPIHCVN